MPAYPKTLTRRLASLGVVTAIGASVLVAAPAQAADDVTLNLLGINDFHGRIDTNTVKFAGTVEQLRSEAGDASTLMVSAGDNVSASLFPSAVQDDIPTIDVLNALQLDASAAGNHEFDQGYDDLVDRIIPAADFPILGANVFRGDERALDASKVFEVDGVRVAVVGAVTQETPSLVSPAGVEGLTFADPAASINDAVAELEASEDPPDVIVASYHEGAPDGSQSLADAMASSAVFRNLVDNTSADVDAIFMGHTHQQYAYDAPVPGTDGRTRPIVQTGSYGANVGQIQLTVDGDTGDVTAHTQRNVPRVATDDQTLIDTYPRVAEVDKITDAALAYAAEVGNEPIGKVTADITTAYANGARDDRASESTLGNLVADSLLAKVSETAAGADIGVVNPGGLRADLLFAGSGDSNGDGVITYAEANAVLPFVNQLNSVTLTGASVKKVLEQQWQRDAAGAVPSRAYLQLGLSKNVSYTYDASRPEGDRITSVTINDEPLDAARQYKVATFSFLATGGDNFRAFTEGTSVDTGLVDYEAWIDYLRDNAPVSPDFARRSVAVSGLAAEHTGGDTVTFALSKLDLTSLGSPANTEVTVELVQGDTVTPLGTAPVSGGAADVSVPLPATASGAATLRVTAAPSGTVANLPITIAKAAEPATPTTVKALGLPIAFQGSVSPVIAQVRTATGAKVGSGTVTVSVDGKELGRGKVSRGLALVLADTRKLGAGRHEVTVTYTGSDELAPSSDTYRLTVIGLRR